MQQLYRSHIHGPPRSRQRGRRLKDFGAVARQSSQKAKTTETAARNTKRPLGYGFDCILQNNWNLQSKAYGIKTPWRKGSTSDLANVVSFVRIVASSDASSPSSSKLGSPHSCRPNFPAELKKFHHDSNQGEVGRGIVADDCREFIGQRTTGQRAKYQMPWGDTSSGRER